MTTEPQTATERDVDQIIEDGVSRYWAQRNRGTPGRPKRAGEAVRAALAESGLVIAEEMALRQTADLLNRIGLYRAADGILNGRAETLEELDV